MFLVVAATEFELEPARKNLAAARNVAFLVTGVGPVEAAFALTRYLALHQDVAAVVNVGVAGAYPGGGLDLLDIGLARREILADFGICHGEWIEALSGETMRINREFSLDNQLFAESRRILELEHLPCGSGTFVTVNCASGTARRGAYLRNSCNAICENMEGAALARVCLGFGVDMVEVRCVSNMVEDRDPAAWRLRDACEAGGDAVARLVRGLSDVALSHR
ncbi:MAG: futalosine hydrolase [Thermodesulfobacteriota bacterium]